MDERDELKVQALEFSYRRLCSFTSHRHMGICNGIEIFCRARGDLRSIRNSLLADIQPKLGSWVFYPDWLVREAYFDIKSLEDFKRGRLAWIDAMIAALRAGEPLPEHPSLPSDFVPRAADGAIVKRKFSI